MRMWMVETILLCKKHLIGEHGECHKFRHNFVKKHNMFGRIKPPAQIEPQNMERRHNELAEGMLRRGYNHKSPYVQPDISYLNCNDVKVDYNYNIKDLKERCPECRKRIDGVVHR